MILVKCLHGAQRILKHPPRLQPSSSAFIRMQKHPLSRRQSLESLQSDSVNPRSPPRMVLILLVSLFLHPIYSFPFFFFYSCAWATNNMSCINYASLGKSSDINSLAFGTKSIKLLLLSFHQSWIVRRSRNRDLNDPRWWQHSPVHKHSCGSGPVIWCIAYSLSNKQGGGTL